MARCAIVALAMLPTIRGAGLSGQDLRPALDAVSQTLIFDGLGCYADDSDRVFQLQTRSDDGNDQEFCASTCADYPYYGLQYGRECWCGDYTTEYWRNGESASCTMECPGDSSQTCGGKWALNVFTQAATDTTAIGCYSDGSDRVLTESKVDKTGLTAESCKAYCSSLGYYYAGTQYGQECWCGDEDADLEKYGTGVCERPCSGDATTYCGGPWAMTVYLADDNEDANYLGCFADQSGNNRVFAESTSSSSNDPEFCEAYCSGLGASYYGLQYGEQCWCGYEGTDVEQHGIAVCDIACPGDPSVTCGGKWAFDAYVIEQTVDDDPATDDAGDDDDNVDECDECPAMSPMDPQPVPAATSVMEMPEYDPDCSKASVRWAESTGVAGRAYFEGGGCATLTDLYEARSDNTGAKGPLYILDENNDPIEGVATPTGKWLLKGELYVEDGSVLYVHGTGIGGDCDELRIQSDPDGIFHEIRGHGGSLSFKSTLVTSWDTTLKAPTDDYEDGRSFINCVSEKEPDVDCVGAAKNDMGECRMDIIDSEMGHLGFFDSESYGLTWKVRGFCVDKSNLEVFDNTNVYGDIINSDIHHMYYGMYSYGHQGGVWTDNIMRDNYQYGFDPHDDSDYLTIARNKVYNNVNHGIIASKRCNNVDIYDNEVYNGGAQAAGIFLHRSTDSAKVYGNYVHDMQDAGLANLESFDSEVYNNVFENVVYGIRISLGGSNNYIHDNEFISCSKYGLYTYMGSDEPDVSDDGRPTNNMFVNNVVMDTPIGCKFKEADDTYVVGNEFTDTEELQFANAYGTIWCGNTIPDGVCMDTIASDTSSEFDLACGLPEEC